VGRRPANRVRASTPLFLPENLGRANELIAALREVADAHQATAAQVALAWVIRHPAVTAIPGASSVEQLAAPIPRKPGATSPETAVGLSRVRTIALGWRGSLGLA
jgi:aryl-alcohol dehydrogenase-like predicted oxidoreductase